MTNVGTNTFLLAMKSMITLTNYFEKCRTNGAFRFATLQSQVYLVIKLELEANIRHQTTKKTPQLWVNFCKANLIVFRSVDLFLYFLLQAMSCSKSVPRQNFECCGHQYI